MTPMATSMSYVNGLRRISTSILCQSGTSPDAVLTPGVPQGRVLSPDHVILEVLPGPQSVNIDLC